MRSCRSDILPFALIVCGAIACGAKVTNGNEPHEGPLAAGEAASSGAQGDGWNDEDVDPDEDTEAVGDATSACIDENPSSQPFYTGDVTVPSPLRRSTAPGLAAATVDTIAAECATNGGSRCDAAAFISKQAALCLAEVNHFPAGLKPWTVALVYHHAYERVVWSVTNVVRYEGADGYWGNILTLDASDGTFLSQSAYVAVP